MAGYESLREGAAWLDLSGRGKIQMHGEDRARLLHAMTTNHIQQLTPGAGCYAYFLSAQGRILADVNVFCRPEFLLLDTEPETRAKVFEHLDKFIIADDVTLEDVTDTTATLALEGPKSAEVLRAIGAPVPLGDHANESWSDGLVARLSYTGGQGFLLFVDESGKSNLVEKLTAAGAEPANLDAFEVIRLEHGRPRYGVDLTERFLAQEANQPQALNFNKGCYLGQEIVERVRSRGQVHRLLMPIQIDVHEPPEPGTKLEENGTNVAEITSAVFSPALQKVVALAYVRADHSKPGTELKLSGLSVRVGNSLSGPVAQ